MSAQSQSSAGSKKMLWAGRVISALPVLGFVFSGVMKLTKSSAVLEEMARLGYPERVIFGIGVTELICVILYAIPQTAVLGAILLTGYLGGAIASHVRAGDPFIAPIVLGVLVWLGLYLRDSRLRALVPLRR